MWYDNWNGQDAGSDNVSEDDFSIRTRARFIFRYSASDSLSAVIRLQYGASGGGMTWGDPNSGGQISDGDSVNDRSGWFADLAVSYKGLDFMVPQLMGMYSSGEDDDVGNGSERMPVVRDDWVFGTWYYAAPISCPAT